MRNKTMKRLTAAFFAAVMVLGSPVTPDMSVEAAEPSLTVDMGAEYRDLYHGATGWLYGQGDDQVPTANTITALKPNTAVQKAPNGMQHPNGDVLDIAKTFLDAGGKHIQIYVPDYYALWFYEFTGTAYYLDILEMQAKACIEAGIQDDVVYVLYNEPTSSWLGSEGYVDDNNKKVTGWDSMYWYWKAMVEKLREVYKEAGLTTEPKTAGLNLAEYDETVMKNYIKFCVEHDVMPDIISWHDLSTRQYDKFNKEYNHYRSLEEQYDIEPREIVINEYAAQAECASPGDLVRWIGLWEDYQVAGCLPFWHFSNNLNGLAANNNAGNGAWWLYKWYGDMSGSYLPVSVANANQNDFYGVASLDENKKSANVIFGGRDGSANIILDDILSTQTFKGATKVHVKVEGTDYTGFHGAAEEPRVIKEGTVAVENGQAVIPMTDMNEMSGYRITVTQASEDESVGLLAASWKVKYEAEDGVRTGSAKVATANNDYACSKRKKVDNVDKPGDSVTIDISVPYDGYYKYDYVYCAATGVKTNDPDNNTPYTAIQELSIDGELVDEMTLPNTINWSMGGMYSNYLYLSKGSHSLKIEAASSMGKAVPDCIYLTYKGQSESDTLFDMTYEAELGEFNEIKKQATTLTTNHEGSIGYITGLEKRRVTEGGGVRFNTVVPENGMYTVTLRYQSAQNTTANLYLDNDMTNLSSLRSTIALKATGNQWKTVYQEVFLQKGINVIDIDTAGAIKLDSMRVRGTEGSAPIVSVEAESGTVTGEAAIGNDDAVKQFSSGNGYVSGLKAANDVEMIEEDDPEFTVLGIGRVVNIGEAVDKNSLTISVNAPQAGSYKLVVYQSNGELFGKHDYNAQMTERYASFSVNGGAAKKVVFRNTYSDETFLPQVVDVNLQAGNNTIKIYNDNSKVVTNGVLKANQTAHTPQNIDYAVLTNYTPNFDKFELYALTGKSGEEKNTYEISALTTDGGRIEVEQTKVTEGESVRLRFVPDTGYCLTGATINGIDIMDKLTEVGGSYTIYPVTQNVEARAAFGPAEETGEPGDKTELNNVYNQYKDYAATTGQGITSDEDWAEFQSALDTALYLQQTNASETLIANALTRLNNAASRLIVLDSIAITKKPAKTTYYVGEGLDVTGLEVTAYDNDKKAHVLDRSKYEIGNFDSGTAGTKTITVSFRGKEAKFTVEVKVRNTQVQAPAAPKIKKGTCTYNSIQIKWNKVNKASGYKIYRSTSKNKGYTLIKTIDKQVTTSFKNTKLDFNKTYYYKVKAYTGSGATVAESGFSNILKAKTDLAKPTVKAKKKSGSSINVSWKKIAGASGYQLQYSLKKKSGYRSVDINKKNAKSYTLKKLKSKKTYYVKLRAFRKVKSKTVYGSWSKVATVKLR